MNQSTEKENPIATEPLDEEIARLVRDLTSAAKFPMPKSEVRRRIKELIASTKKEIK